MSKYLAIARIGWSSGFIYRLNFVMWRARMVIQLLTIYYLWVAILRYQPNAFGYTPEQMFTYILASSVLKAVVFSSRSVDVQAEISSGDLNNYLVRPINYFKYWFSRDLADKLLNVAFSTVELSLLLIILKPPFILPPSPLAAIFFILSACLALVLYFFFSLIVSCSVFWMPEGSGWPQRFLIFILLEFLAGGLFPLDILPPELYQLVLRLPTAYFIYIPMQIYLGRLIYPAVIQAFVIMALWLIALSYLAKALFTRGLKVYGAYGR